MNRKLEQISRKTIRVSLGRSFQAPPQEKQNHFSVVEGKEKSRPKTTTETDVWGYSSHWFQIYSMFSFEILIDCGICSWMNIQVVELIFFSLLFSNSNHCPIFRNIKPPECNVTHWRDHEHNLSPSSEASQTDATRDWRVVRSDPLS